MAEMLQHLETILVLPDLESFPKTKRLPAKLFEHLDLALGCYDRYIEHVIAAERWQVSCYKGCSACCRYELARGITVLEAVNIYRHVRSWPDIEDIYEQNGENMVAFQQLLAKELSGQRDSLQPDDPRIVEAHLLNFLSGAFVNIAGDVMEGEPITTYDTD